MKKCRICGNTNLVEVINLGKQTLTGVFPKNKEDKITEGLLRLTKCSVSGEDEDNACGLVQLADSYDLEEMYGLNYGYRSGLNSSMVKHLHQKVEKILDIAKLEKNDLIIDIGSNDGTTLSAYPNQYMLVGIDPSGLKFSKFYPEHIKLIPDFFSAKLIEKEIQNKKAKVITSFSMFYDLEEPLVFMSEVYDCLDDEGLWIFEQSYMPYMLEKNSYDTICQEHLEYYSLKQIAYMCKKVGFKIIDVEFNNINGGSFSIIVAKLNSSFIENEVLIQDILSREIQLGLDTLAPWEVFVKNVHKSKEDLLNFLNKCKESNKTVFGLGASTKGNVILQYCGIDDSLLSLIGEVNEDKLGSYTPGTLIPIVSEQEVLKSNPDYLLILPWHFKDFFINNPKFKGMKLVFPLPSLEIIEC